MRTTVRHNLVLAVVMVVGCAGLWIATLGLRPGSAFFPRILLAIIICCALAIAGEQVVTMRRGRREPGGAPPRDAAEAHVPAPDAPETGEGPGTDESGEGRGHAREWLTAAALVVYVVGFVYVGPYTATFALLAGLYLMLSPVRTWKMALAGALLAAALTAVLYGLFSIGLSVSMPDGILI